MGKTKDPKNNGDERTLLSGRSLRFSEKRIGSAGLSEFPKAALCQADPVGTVREANQLPPHEA